MNIFQLVLKQMRQRMLSTFLTLLSVVLGMALAVSVLILRRESEALFTQSDFGYDLLVGPKGSPMQLVLNTVYQVDRAPGNISYKVYGALRNDPRVRFAVPYAVGDNYNGIRVAGTTPEFFGFNFDGKPAHGWDDKGKLKPGFKAPGETGENVAARVFEIRMNRRFTVAQGRMFHPRRFEAVLGADVGAKAGLKMGDKFKVSHEAADSVNKHEHDERWTVVGVLDKTHTAQDRVIFVPLDSFFAIPGHLKAMTDQTDAQEGRLDERNQKPPAPATRPASQPATHPAHDDHDDHDHPATKPAATRAATLPTHAHDDHEHDHAATKPAATRAATLPAHAHDDHDHPATQPATTRAATSPAHDDHDDHKGHAHDEPYTLNADGTFDLKTDRNTCRISAVFVKAKGVNAMSLEWSTRYSKEKDAQAVFPSQVMAEFFDMFLRPTTLVLLLISILVVVTAGISILVSIYNAVSARSREIAIMRALGATRGRILTLVCLEAGIVGSVGALLGLVIGHALGAIQSRVFVERFGTAMNYMATDIFEWLYLIGVVLLAILAGLVPGLKAYRTPVATNLVAS